MSWDSYLEGLVAASKGSVTKAVFIGKMGENWTDQNHPNVLKIQEEEWHDIAAVMSRKDPKEIVKFRTHGVVVDGVKFEFKRDVNMDGRKIYASKDGWGGLILQSTLQTVIIAYTPEGADMDIAYKAVDDTAKQMETSGF